MKTKTCKIILLLLLSSLALVAKQYKHNLLEYANLTAIHNKVDILISDEINPNEFYFFTDKEYPTASLNLFKTMVESKDLLFSYHKGLYFIEKPKEIDLNATELNETKKLYSFNLESKSNNDIQNLLNLYDINNTYTTNNKVFFRTDKEKYKELNNALMEVDILPKQTRLKITVIETNLNKLKERGFEISGYLKTIDNIHTQYYLNLITMPYTNNQNIIKFAKKEYYGVIKYLNRNDFSQIKSSPILTAKNNTNVYFSSVQNIPYLKQSKEVKDNQTSNTNSYEYKDIGLKINIKPIILKEHVDIDLHLILEDLLSDDSLTPVTSKKEIRSSYLLKKGEILVLSGINKTTNYTDHFEIPLLSKIFLVGDLFKFDTKKQLDTTLALSIEALE